MKRRVELARSYRRQFAEHLDHPDQWQRHAARVGHDYQLEVERSYDLGLRYLKIRHTGGIMDSIRDVFDEMKTSRRKAGKTSPPASKRWISLWQERWQLSTKADDGGSSSARLQVESTIEQARHLAGEQSKWLGLAQALRKRRSVPDVVERVAQGGRPRPGGDGRLRRLSRVGLSAPMHLRSTGWERNATSPRPIAFSGWRSIPSRPTSGVGRRSTGSSKRWSRRLGALTRTRR